MELTREHFRAIMFYNFRRGLSQQQGIDELISTFGDEAPSRTSVYRWFAEFVRGRNSLVDEFREGRPKSVVVPENIDSVRELILQDRHLTYRKIEASLDISGTSIQTILHEHLAVKKVCSRWIPRNLSGAQKQARVDWCKDMLNTAVGLRNMSMILSQVTNCGSTRMNRKINSSRQCGSFKVNKIQQKVFVHEVLQNQWLPVSSEKLGILQLFL